MNYWTLISRFVWIVLILLVAAGLFFVFLPKTNQVRTMQGRKAELAAENRHIEAETGTLREMQRKFMADPAFVERTAREQGMVKPGEVVFKFDETTPEDMARPSQEE